MELCNTRQVVLARLYHGSGDEEMTDKISYNEWIKKIELARKEARTALLDELSKWNDSQPTSGQFGDATDHYLNLKKWIADKRGDKK